MLSLVDIVSQYTRIRCRGLADFRTSRLLVRHPKAMARLREEIKLAVPESDHPTREQVMRMPYLASVVKECKWRPVSLAHTTWNTR